MAFLFTASAAKIYIHLTNEITEPAQLAIYDITGKAVFKGYLNQQQNVIELYEQPKRYICR